MSTRAKTLTSWEEFIKELDILNIFINENTATKNSGVLFRGQPNSEWHLNTTLERYAKENFTIRGYDKLIKNSKDEISAFTGKTWRFPPKFTENLKAFDPSQESVAKFLPLDYMVYIRHQGFPSPLLDWTRSPYIAAYFAFRDLTNDAKEVAIYAYIEHLGNKTEWSSALNIKTIRTPVSSEIRHFLQQSDYTICTAGEGNNTYYGNFEKGVESNAKYQNILWKFNIPITERKKALKILDLYNINAYSLFKSEESLMETVFLRSYL